MATTTHDLKLRALLDLSQVKQQVQQLNSKNTVNLDASGISHSINLLNQTIAKFTNSLEKLSQNTHQAAVKINNASNQSFTLGRLGEIGKVVAGIAVERAGGSAKNYFEATGNVAAANTSDFLSKFGRGALAGSAGGWIGAAIGGGFGALEFAFEKLAENAKKAAEELAAYQKVLTDARVADQAILAREKTEKFSKLLATGSTQEIENERAIREAQIAASNATKLAFRSQFGDNAIENATKRIQALKEERKDVTSKLEYLDEGPGDMTVYDYIVKRRKDEKLFSDQLAAIDAEIAEITNGIESYKKAEEERVKYTNELKQLNVAIAQRKAAEEQAAKAAAAKAEIERKAAEAEQKRIEIESQRNEAIIKKLRQTDAEGTESDEISNMLKSGDIQTLNKMLANIRSKTELAEAEYNKYLEAGEGDKATEARRQLMRYRGYESSIVSGITGLEKDEQYKNISGLNDQYNNLLNQLQKQLSPTAAVSNLQAMGGSMGWVDRSTESIDNNVQKIVTQLQSILTQIRKTDTTTGLILL